MKNLINYILIAIKDMSGYNKVIYMRAIIKAKADTPMFWVTNTAYLVLMWAMWISVLIWTL